MRRTFMIIPGCLQFAAVLFVASPSHAAGQSQNLFTASYSTGFSDLDPSAAFSSENAVLANVYEPLVWYKIPAAGEAPKLVPGLAVSWTESDDGKTWTFKLRDGVKFHDGTAFDSMAVKGSVERTKKLKRGAAWIWDAVTSIETPDPLTVVFRLSKPTPIDLVATSTYAAWIISPKALDKDNAWFNQGHDAGTGPYRIRDYKANQQIVLDHFPDYWEGWKRGQIDVAVFEDVEDSTLRQQKIQSGDIDWTQQIPPDNLDGLKSNADLTLVVNPSFFNLEGLINTKKKPLDNPKVRQAISYAFPYNEVVTSVMGGYAQQARGIIPAGMDGYDSNAFQYSLNLIKAKELLSEAGLPNGGFALTLTYSVGNLVQQQAAELYKASLAKIGVTLNIEPMSWAARSSLARSDAQKAQDIFVLNWYPTYVTPYDFLVNMFKTEDTPLFNLSNYKNQHFDSLLEKANDFQAYDKARATAGFQDAQKIIIDDAVALFIFDQKNVHVIRSNVKGYVDQPAYGEVIFLYDLTKTN